MSALSPTDDLATEALRASGAVRLAVAGLEKIAAGKDDTAASIAIETILQVGGALSARFPTSADIRRALEHYSGVLEEVRDA